MGLQGPHSGSLCGSSFEERGRLVTPRPHCQAIADRHPPCSGPIQFQSLLGVHQKVVPSACKVNTPSIQHPLLNWPAHLERDLAHAFDSMIREIVNIR